MMHKALFLDRDGVVNVEKNYLFKKEDFVFINGIFDLCRHYSQKGYLIFIVTNQSGIARGYYSESDFINLNNWMIGEFKKKGVEISKIYYCPHHPDYGNECECRKPKPKMLLDAKEEFDLDMSSSLLVGDKERDIEAALNAGVKETYLLLDSSDFAETKATKIIHQLDEIWK